MKITVPLRKAYNYFRRPKTTAVIILILLVLFVMGLFIPQRRFFASLAQYNEWKMQSPVLSAVIEYLKLNEIYVAPITVFFLGVFFVNLITVIVHRIPHVLRRAYLIDRERATSAAEHIRDDSSALKVLAGCSDRQAADALMDRAVLFFRKRFWSVFRSGSGASLLAVRNRLSPFGFLFFHVSFLLCLVGGLLLVYTRFSGNLTLSEGEEFHSEMSRFRTIKDDPILFKALPDLGMTLLKVSPNYEGNVATDLNVLMRFKYEDAQADVEGRINSPIKKGPVSILPVSVGISPLFVLNNEKGEEITGGFFVLNVMKGDEDSFAFEGMPYRFFVRFFPDFEEKNGEAVTRSLKMNNPVFRIRVEREGTVLHEGLVRKGGSATFGGLELSNREIRYWVDFLVVREYGNSLLFAGFLIGAAGLIMRLVFYQKTVRLNMEHRGDQCEFSISGTSEYYTQTFQEELQGIAVALEREFISLQGLKGER